MSHYVYILANKRNGTLYTGVTRNLLGRIHQRKIDSNDAFTKRYQIHKLEYYEDYEKAEDAIVREKRLKKWNRQWKIELIECNNPQWRDLYEDIIDPQSSW